MQSPPCAPVVAVSRGHQYGLMMDFPKDRIVFNFAAPRDFPKLLYLRSGDVLVVFTNVRLPKFCTKYQIPVRLCAMPTPITL